MEHDSPIEIDPTSAVPIWRQIEDGVRRAVAAGRLEPGAQVPSVREMAVRLTVNPATVAKAYRRLIDQGLLAVRRGEGTFVARGVERRLPGLRRGELARAAERYAREAAALGVDPDTACEAVRAAWPQEDGRRRR